MAGLNGGEGSIKQLYSTHFTGIIELENDAMAILDER